MKNAIIVILVILLAMAVAHAEPRERKDRDYILRRQEAGQVQGTPTLRLNVGKRQIDVYPNGLMFEGDNVVGVKK